MPYTKADAERDRKELLEASDQHEAEGDRLMAGMMRVEAGNCEARVGMKKPHCNNLGPYSDDNPCYCIHCGKPRSEWVEGEECIPVPGLELSQRIIKVD